jgi:hypothetical protein
MACAEFENASLRFTLSQIGAMLGSCRRQSALNCKFAGVFETPQEAQTAATATGTTDEVHWGSYDPRDKQSVGGDFR